VIYDIADGRTLAIIELTILDLYIINSTDFFLDRVLHLREPPIRSSVETFYIRSIN